MKPLSLLIFCCFSFLAFGQIDSICLEKQEVLYEIGKRYTSQDDGYISYQDVIGFETFDNIVYRKIKSYDSFHNDTMYSYYRIDSLGFSVYDQLYEKHVLIIPRDKKKYTFTIEDSWGKAEYSSQILNTKKCNFSNFYIITFRHPELKNGEFFVNYFHWDYGFIGSKDLYDDEITTYLIEISSIDGN